MTTAKVRAYSRDRQIPAWVRERFDCNQAALCMSVMPGTWPTRTSFACVPGRELVAQRSRGMRVTPC